MQRELRAEDAEAVAALIKAAAPDRAIDADEVRSWLTQGVVDPADMRVLDDDGRVVGYVDIFLRDDLAMLDPAGRVDELLDWAEGRARERGAAKVRLPVWAGSPLEDVLPARRYLRVRSSFEMLIELGDEPPPEPEWPADVRVCPFEPDEERTVWEVQEETFRDVWDYRPTPFDLWRKFSVESRGFDPSLWFVAREGDEEVDEIAGICLAFPQHGPDTSLGWINILGVRRRWRRRGVGEALLRHAFRELHARGFRRIGLGVDAESPTGATRLYERVGMRVWHRADSWDKTL